MADLAGGVDSVHDSKCFGNDAAVVSMMAAESVNAFHGKGIKTAAGMFPGKGNGSNVTKDWTEWENSDALPFRAVINVGTECIMVGNVTCEPLTGDAQTLCSLSEEAVYYTSPTRSVNSFLVRGCFVFGFNLGRNRSRT